MQRLWTVLGIILVLLATSGQAEVLDATDHGFVSEHKLILEAGPATAYQALTERVHLWWDAEHSYFGDARNFHLHASAGGCFCETVADKGSVEHMRVVNAQSGKSLTMQGGLGPLQGMGVSGSMSFRFQRHEQGSLLTYRYVVGGYTMGGLLNMAEPVDQVQFGQLQRLQQYLASGQALN